MWPHKIVMFYPYVNDRARELVQETLSTRWIGQGPRVEEFEAKLRAQFGFKFAVALNSGTAGLHLALAIAGVGPGDEVITPAYTCTATNMPILAQFADPVFADIQHGTGNLDPTDIEHRITKRTRAIMCVHWAGYPCDLDQIHDVARRHDLPVIEDAAHALGATYKGQAIGNISQFTMFSFQAIKQLTCGDGGLLTTRSLQTYTDAMRRRWFGIDKLRRVQRPDGYAFWNQSVVGYKFHMNDIAASIGLGNLEAIEWILQRRAEIASFYREAFANVPGVRLLEQADDRTSGNWLFTMHVERRDLFCYMMRSRNIEVSVVHIRNDAHRIFGTLRYDLPNTRLWSQSNISIPIGVHLTDRDVEMVIDAVEGGW